MVVEVKQENMRAKTRRNQNKQKPKMKQINVPICRFAPHKTKLYVSVGSTPYLQ
jgi:hypothetical protein